MPIVEELKSLGGSGDETAARLAELLESSSFSGIFNVRRKDSGSETDKDLASTLSSQIAATKDNYSGLNKDLTNLSLAKIAFPNANRAPLASENVIDSTLTPAIFLALKYPDAKPDQIKKTIDTIKRQLGHEKGVLNGFFSYMGTQPLATLKEFNDELNDETYKKFRAIHAATPAPSLSAAPGDEVKGTLSSGGPKPADASPDSPQVQAIKKVLRLPLTTPENKSETLTGLPKVTTIEDLPKGPIAAANRINVLIEKTADKIAASQKNYSEFVQYMKDNFSAVRKAEDKEEPAALIAAWTYIAHRHAAQINHEEDMPGLKKLAEKLCEVHLELGTSPEKINEIHTALKLGQTPQEDHDALQALLLAKKSIKRDPTPKPPDPIIKRGGGRFIPSAENKLSKEEKDQIAEFIQLTNHYRKLSFLSVHSQYHFAERKEHNEKYKELYNTYTALWNAHPGTMRTISTSIPTNYLPEPGKPKDIQERKELNTELTKTELETIYHFGQGSTVKSNESKVDIDPATPPLAPDLGAPPLSSPHLSFPPGKAHPDLAKNEVRETAFNLPLWGGGGAAPLQGRTIEHFPADDNGNKRFVLESRLPDEMNSPDANPNALMSWACTSVNRFFASAPAGTKGIKLTDGYTPEQLAAVVSYCEFMGYDHTIGDKQKLRLAVLADSSALSPELKAQLNSGQPIRLTADLIELANSTKVAEDCATLMQSRSASLCSPKKWQPWFDRRDVQGLHTQIPPLGHEKHKILSDRYEDSGKDNLATITEKLSRLTAEEGDKEKDHLIVNRVRVSKPPLEPIVRPVGKISRDRLEEAEKVVGSIFRPK